MTIMILNFVFSHSIHLELEQVYFWKVKQMILKHTLQRITDLSAKPNFIDEFGVLYNMTDIKAEIVMHPKNSMKHIYIILNNE